MPITKTLFKIHLYDNSAGSVLQIPVDEGATAIVYETPCTGVGSARRGLMIESEAVCFG